jgi:uncharacterized protein VirK/YbjX
LGLILGHRDELRAWYGMRDNPHLHVALQRFPQMHGAVYWPYIHNAWPMRRRLEVIDQHYRLLEGRAAILAYAVQQEIHVAALENEYAGLRLVLDKAAWFLREGEVVLNLFVADRRIYSVAFSLAIEAGMPVVLVGAIQGANVEGISEVYKELTRATHGMRPRDLLITTLQMLCQHIGIGRLFCISNDCREHNSQYFGDSHRKKLRADYNEIWIEHGGVALDTGFFEIPVQVKYRQMQEIPSRKRAVYRRRYEMFGRLEAAIAAICARYRAETTVQP